MIILCNQYCTEYFSTGRELGDEVQHVLGFHDLEMQIKQSLRVALTIASSCVNQYENASKSVRL